MKNVARSVSLFRACLLLSPSLKMRFARAPILPTWSHMKFFIWRARWWATRLPGMRR